MNIIFPLKITIGMPPLNEYIISSPLPENELRQIIHKAYGNDETTAMLTQVKFLIKTIKKKSYHPILY